MLGSRSSKDAAPWEETEAVGGKEIFFGNSENPQGLPRTIFADRSSKLNMHVHVSRSRNCSWVHARIVRHSACPSPRWTAMAANGFTSKLVPMVMKEKQAAPKRRQDYADRIADSTVSKETLSSHDGRQAEGATERALEVRMEQRLVGDLDGDVRREGDPTTSARTMVIGERCTRSQLIVELEIWEEDVKQEVALSADEGKRPWQRGGGRDHAHLPDGIWNV